MVTDCWRWVVDLKQQKKDFKKPNEQRSCGHSANFIVDPNCGTDLVGRKELATLLVLQTTAQDDCLRAQQFPDRMNILWDTPLPPPPLKGTLDNIILDRYKVKDYRVFQRTTKRRLSKMNSGRQLVVLSGSLPSV